MTFNWRTTPYKPHVVYRAYSVDGLLLYIGASCDLDYRLQNHAAESPWWFACHRITTEPFPDRAAALVAEREAIFTEQPVFNMRHTGRPPRREVIVEPHVPAYVPRHAAVEVAA